MDKKKKGSSEKQKMKLSNKQCWDEQKLAGQPSELRCKIEQVKSGHRYYMRGQTE
jgi:hypothetical protein